MKSLFLFFFLPGVAVAQNDTIFRKDGKVIPCTITLDNGLSLYYTRKGVNEPIEKDKISYFVQNGKRMSADVDIAKTEITGQVLVNGVDINSRKISYCEIVGTDFNLSKSRMIINIDYGQSYTQGESMIIESKRGQPIIFNSMVDALNFMESNGWQYVNQYAVASGNSDKVYRILLKRK